MKVLGYLLAILTRYRVANWDLYCRTIAFAYRTIIYPGINNTLAYLTFGIDLKLPIDCDIYNGRQDENTEE